MITKLEDYLKTRNNKRDINRTNRTYNKDKHKKLSNAKGLTDLFSKYLLTTEII